MTGGHDNRDVQICFVRCGVEDGPYADNGAHCVDYCMAADAGAASGDVGDYGNISVLKGPIVYVSCCDTDISCDLDSL